MSAHLSQVHCFSTGNLESEISCIVPTISDLGPLTSSSVLDLVDCGACAVNHTRSPRSPAPLCPALAATPDYSAMPRSTITSLRLQPQQLLISFTEVPVVPAMT